MERISILSMFRDSEKYLHDAFERLEALDKATPEFEFEYFFYENDSVDNTVPLLENWLRNKPGRLITELLNKPKFGSVPAQERMNDLTYYRNTLLNENKPFSSSYSLLLDSDVQFEPDLIQQYIDCLDDQIVMITPNVLQNIKCKMCDCKTDSYYDSWALIDRYGNHGMTWSSNPFYHPDDRAKWESNNSVSVKSAFGGCPMIKTSSLNKVEWSTDSGCEHWNFCRDVINDGIIVVAPTVVVKVELGASVIEGLNDDHVSAVISQQHRRLSMFKNADLEGLF